MVSLVDWKHNHAREVPENCPIPRRPDAKQREAISALAVSTESRFNRSQLAEVLVAQTGYAPEPRQISNIINQARRASRDKVNEFGGDIHAIVASLEQKMLDEPGLTYRLKIDEDRNVTGIWWQYPQQASLARRYHDVLINDNTYGRNNSAMALNIGVVIDGYNASRNIWYGFQLVEDQGHHAWMLRCHLESAGRAPEIFVSDRDGALIAAVAEVLPTAEHIFCIHHLEGNEMWTLTCGEHFHPINGQHSRRNSGLFTEQCHLKSSCPNGVNLLGNILPQSLILTKSCILAAHSGHGHTLASNSPAGLGQTGELKSRIEPTRILVVLGPR